jgi:threonine synthase
LSLVTGEMFERATLAQRPHNLWRYMESLGLADGTPSVSLGEVVTPLLPSSLGGKEVLCKLEYFSPTASFKDRGVSVMMTQLKAWGLKEFVLDSSGNAGSSAAAYAAAAGLTAHIYVPAATSDAKVRQIGAYGATLHRVEGGRAETAAVAMQAGRETFYGNHTWSPFYHAGMKTLAYEIAEQMDWQTPDWVVMPCGGGSSVLEIAEGFEEMLRAGMVAKKPRLLAVQSAACPPIQLAWSKGEDHTTPFIVTPSVAEGVAMANPIRGREVLKALRDSNGVMQAVSEEEIIAAWKECARKGIFIEPTSAVAPAGLAKTLKSDAGIKPDDLVVVVMTGSGLKSQKIV